MTNDERDDAELRRVQRQVRALEGPALGVRDSEQESLPYINDPSLRYWVRYEAWISGTGQVEYRARGYYGP